MSVVSRLREELSQKFYSATHHQFTNELCAGTLADAKLYTYLVQDAKFFMISLKSLARTIQLCDSDASTVVLGRQMGFFCADENTYFERSLQELRDSGFTADIPALPEVEEFLAFLRTLTTSESYVRNIVALYTFELVYLLWAEPHEKTVDHLQFKHKEWVYLHSGPDFTKWVQFLESEVLRVVNAGNLTEARETMSRVVDLENMFFESTYNYDE